MTLAELETMILNVSFLYILNTHNRYNKSRERFPLLFSIFCNFHHVNNTDPLPRSFSPSNYHLNGEADFNDASPPLTPRRFRVFEAKVP